MLNAFVYFKFLKQVPVGKSPTFPLANPQIVTPVTADDVSGMAQLDITITFAVPQNISFVRMYPYYLIEGTKYKEVFENDPRTHLYNHPHSYIIQLKTMNNEWLDGKYIKRRRSNVVCNYR